MTPQELARKRAHQARVQDYFDMLSRNEGIRKKVYLDSKGHPTIGIGFNLNAEHNQQFLKDKGIDKQSLLAGRELTKNELLLMYNHSLKQAFKDARKYDPNFDKRPESVKKGLVDMSFNMGLTKLNTFEKMKEGLDANDYAKVAREAQDSNWFKQVKSRGPRTVGLFKEAIK
jgi:GH24 family phage-related lysozyme (muramidase)